MFPFLETVCQLRSEEWTVLWRVGQLLALRDTDVQSTVVSTVDILETVSRSRGLTVKCGRRIKSVRLLRDGTLEILYCD